MKEKIYRKVIEQSKKSTEETAGTNGKVENLPDPQRGRSASMRAERERKREKEKRK